MTGNDITELGKNILKTERGFNLATGFTNTDHRLPEFFNVDLVLLHNVVWAFTDEEIDEFWNF